MIAWLTSSLNISTVRQRLFHVNVKFNKNWSACQSKNNSDQQMGDQTKNKELAPAYQLLKSFIKINFQSKLYCEVCYCICTGPEDSRVLKICSHYWNSLPNSVSESFHELEARQDISNRSAQYLKLPFYHVRKAIAAEFLILQMVVVQFFLRQHH